MSTSELRERLSGELRVAMKAREKQTVVLLRTLMATLDNAEAVTVDLATLPKVATTERHEVPRKLLSEDEIRALLQREIAERRHNCAEYEALGLPEKATQLQQEAELIASYL